MTRTEQLTIVEVDPRDDDLFDAWHATYAAATRHGHEEIATVWTLEELRVQMQRPTERSWERAFAGLRDGAVVCSGSAWGSTVDNLETAAVNVATLPDQRGRGHGTAMLARLEEFARGRGRRRLLAEAAWPFAADPQGAGVADVGFALARGFDLGLVDVKRLLALPVAAELLDRLAGEAAPHHAAYTLRSWEGPVPDDLAVGWAELSASLMTEAPTGEIEREPENADVAGLREAEEVLVRQGRRKYNTVALDAEGAVVAYTDVATTVHEPDRAYQWGTLVRRADRGHRLGMAVKAANLRLLQATQPEIERVITWNAEVNSHMVGVNERLGFHPVERLGEFQKTLT